jgi:hypothetical protein
MCPGYGRAPGRGPGRGPSRKVNPTKTGLADHGDRCYLPEAVRETEEVIPVNVSTWVLPSGATVGR